MLSCPGGLPRPPPEETVCAEEERTGWQRIIHLLTVPGVDRNLLESCTEKPR